MRIILLPIAILLLSSIPAQSSEKKESKKNKDKNFTITSNSFVKIYLQNQARTVGLNPKNLIINEILLPVLGYSIDDYRIKSSECCEFFTVSSTIFQNYYSSQKNKKIVKPNKQHKRILKTIAQGLNTSSNTNHQCSAFYALIDQYVNNKIISQNNQEAFIQLFYANFSKKPNFNQFITQNILLNIVENASARYKERKNYIFGPCYLPSKKNNSTKQLFARMLSEDSTLHESSSGTGILVNTGKVYKWNKKENKIIHHNKTLRKKSTKDVGDLDHGISLIAFSNLTDLKNNKRWAIITYLPKGLKIKQQGNDLFHHVIVPTESEKEDLFENDNFRAYQLNCNKLCLMGLALFSQIFKNNNNKLKVVKKIIKKDYCN